jgi:hypothetical protein
MSKTVLLPNCVLVNSFRIIGTSTTVYEAFEPSSYTGNHSTLKRFNNSIYGSIASRRTGSRSENANEAIQYILDAFPHLEQLEYGIDEFMGRIELERIATI